MTKIQQYIYNKGTELPTYHPNQKELAQLDKQGYICNDGTNYYEYIIHADNGHWYLLKMGLCDDASELMELIANE